MEIDTSHNFTKQFPRNLAANIGYFVVNIIVGILLVPYFVSTLGVAAYGLIPLATSITGYVAIIVQSLNTAVSRFLTVDLQREDYTAANRTFNTAFFGLTAVVLLMIPVVIAVAYYVPVIFSVPSGQENGSTLLFLGVCTALLLRSWSGNFTVQLFAYNRLDLQNIVNLTNFIVQTGLIVLSFTLFGPNLAFVGGAYIAGALVASAISIVLAKRICQHLSISVRSFDRSKIRDLCGMGWWVSVGYIGGLLFSNIDLIVVNMIFGAPSAGEYAIAQQWSILIQTIGGLLAGILTPMVISYYARGQIETLTRVLKSSIKMMGLALALPIGYICGFARELITIWVGEERAFLALLVVILVLPQLINQVVTPLLSVNVAYNRTRIPGIVTILMGILNLLLAIILSLFTDLGYYGVALAGIIIVTFKHAFFNPWYAGRILGIPTRSISAFILPGIIATILVWGVTAIISNIFVVTTLSSLISIGSIITIIYLVIMWSVGLDNYERHLILSMIPTNLRNIFEAYLQIPFKQ